MWTITLIGFVAWFAFRRMILGRWSLLVGLLCLPSVADGQVNAGISTVPSVTVHFQQAFDDNDGPWKGFGGEVYSGLGTVNQQGSHGWMQVIDWKVTFWAVNREGSPGGNPERSAFKRYTLRFSRDGEWMKVTCNNGQGPWFSYIPNWGFAANDYGSALFPSANMSNPRIYNLEEHASSMLTGISFGGDWSLVPEEDFAEDPDEEPEEPEEPLGLDDILKKEAIEADAENEALQPPIFIPSLTMKGEGGETIPSDPTVDLMLVVDAIYPLNDQEGDEGVFAKLGYQEGIPDFFRQVMAILKAFKAGEPVIIFEESEPLLLPEGFSAFAADYGLLATGGGMNVTALKGIVDFIRAFNCIPWCVMVLIFCAKAFFFALGINWRGHPIETMIED